MTILLDDFSRRPKGMAKVEFATDAQVQAATALSGSSLMGRPIMVTPNAALLLGLAGPGMMGLMPPAPAPMGMMGMMGMGRGMPFGVPPPRPGGGAPRGGPVHQPGGAWPPAGGGGPPSFFKSLTWVRGGGGGS